MTCGHDLDLIAGAWRAEGTVAATLAGLEILRNLADARSTVHQSIHVANLGGAFPFYLERLRAVASDDPDGSAWFFDPGRLRVDSASFGAGAIGMALDTLGRDRVLPGTDMPLFEPTRAVLGLRRALCNSR